MLGRQRDWFDGLTRRFKSETPNHHGREEFELPLQVQLLLDDKDADKRVPVPASKADQVLEVDPKEPRLGRNGKVGGHAGRSDTGGITTRS